MFRWVNGDLLSYNFWRDSSEEPNGKETENCVAMTFRYGRFVDASCKTWPEPRAVCSDQGWYLKMFGLPSQLVKTELLTRSDCFEPHFIGGWGVKRGADF